MRTKKHPMTFKTWWGKPEYNGIKALIFVAIAAILGYFVFNYMHTGSLLGTGQVDQTAQIPVLSAVTTTAATGVTSTAATLSASVPVAAASLGLTLNFNYGTTPAYGLTAPATAASGTATATVSGLTCGTTYHYTLVSTTAIGTSTGGDKTFQTSTCSSVYVTKHKLATPPAGPAM